MSLQVTLFCMDESYNILMIKQGMITLDIRAKTVFIKYIIYFQKVNVKYNTI